MKKLRILKQILNRTKAIQLLSSFLICVLICAGIIVVVEPDITSYFDAIWYCYAVITTCGFGDFAAVTLIGRLASIFISVYAVFAIAIVTGVVVNYYMQLINVQQKETLSAVIDKLERLPELSQEELVQISDHVKEIHDRINRS